MSVFLRNLSIGRRLIIIVIAINLLILLSIGLIAISSYEQALESQATGRFEEKNEQVAQGITDELDKVIATTNQLQATLSALPTDSQADMRSAIRDVISQDDDILIHRISVYRPSEVINGEATDDSVVVFQIFAPRTGNINETRTFSFDNQQPLPTDPMFSALDTTQGVWFVQPRAYADAEEVGAVSLAVPYDYSADLQGVIWVDIPQPIFDDMIATQLNRVGLLSETLNGYSVLIDHTSALVDRHGERATDLTIDDIREILTRTQQASRVDNLDLIESPMTGEALLVARDDISTNDWQLVSVLPRADIPTSSGILILQLLAIAIIGIGMMILAVNYFSRITIVEPLQNLSRAAQEIGSGDLRYYIDYRAFNDEIGFLARAMEGMKGNISHSYNELRNWSQTLETRVNQRTKELNITRREAEDSANELRAVYDESLLVVNEPMLEPILEAFTYRILSLMDASYCSVWLLDDTETTLQLANNTDDPQAIGYILPVPQGMVGQCVSKQQSIVIDDYAEYEHRVDLSYQTVVPYVRAMAVPLMFDGYAKGAVVVGRPVEGDLFTDADTQRLTLFANLVSPAVRNAQLFNQRESARREAERANQVKTRFLASVTHELRTPLNLIINNMDFMRIGVFGDVNDEQLSRLNQTVRSAEHLLYLINDLLDVSKIEAGEMQLFIQPSHVMTIIEDSLDSTEAFIEKLENKMERVKIISDIEDDLPQIPIDARRIRQVLTNLLSNAVKFTHDGEVRLTVKATPDGIYFAVQDTGIGIPEEEQHKLFEAFERTTQAKEQNIEGTGLGLPISQYLIQQHGGQILVDSVAGEGTTFKFTLPYTLPVASSDNMTIAKSDE